jgi:NADH-quinone oxidoreductase subunit M
MWLGVIGIVYGGIMVFAQNDIKRLVAFSSISHMGFVLVGIYAGTEQALQGVVMQMLAHGISAGALFILCGEIYERLHTRELSKMGGLWSRFAYLPPIALFFAMASLGLPGLGNFVGEFLILLGTWPISPLITILSATGLVLAAVYSLMMVQKAFHGPSSAEHDKLEDLNRREIGLMVSLMLILLWMGLYPQPFLDTTAAPMKAVHEIYSGAIAPLPAPAVAEVLP